MTTLVPGELLGHGEQHENECRLELGQDPLQLVPAHLQRQMVNCVPPSGFREDANGLGVRDQRGYGCKRYTDTNRTGERNVCIKQSERG